MEQLIKRIDDLSLRDSKSLSQKGLKAVEEVGELAKAILPLEGAHGTNHRLPSTEKVAEECADVMLVVYSIMKTLGYSIQDIAEIIDRKANYWEFLLDNEDKADMDNLAFEVHITVDNAASPESFAQTCAELEVKPIILDLYNQGEPIKDVMTSSVYRGSTKQAVTYAKSIADALRHRGYSVLREKIETVPWHPAALIKPAIPSAYFEAHFAFEDDKALVSYFANLHGIHLSRNMMKKGDKSVVMGTFREAAKDTSADSFQRTVNNIFASAKDFGLTITKKPHTEYSLFDTNEQHDKEWVKGKV